MLLPIEEIIADCSRAAEAFQPSSSTTRIAWVAKRIGEYKKSLKRISRASTDAQVHLAEKLIINSATARMLAYMRVCANRNEFPSSLQIGKEALALNLWEPTYEPVLVRVKFAAGKPKPRFIVEVGLKRAAKSIVLKDYVLALGLFGQDDYALRGKGGIRGLMQRISKDMVTGYTHWSCPDITNCYLSLRKEHFHGLPIKDSLITNVAFLPEGIITVIYKPEDKKALALYLADAHPSSATKDVSSLTSLVTKMVRQSLPLGLATSTLLASWFIQEVVNATKMVDVRFCAYADNLALGAKCKSEVKIAIDAVAKAFALHPAGPIGLHDMKVTSSKNTSALGYDLIPGKGYGGNKVHVKPNQQSFSKFKVRLACKLASASDDIPELFEIADKYAAAWFGGMSAWTKVPLYSWDACRNITWSYVSDWQSKIPMGTKKLNVPHKTLGVAVNGGL